MDGRMERDGRAARLSAVVDALHGAAAARDDVEDLHAEALAAFLAERDLAEAPRAGPATAAELAVRAVLDACGPQDRDALRALCRLAGMSGTAALAGLRHDGRPVGGAPGFDEALDGAVARCLATAASVAGGRTRFRPGRLPPRAPLPGVHPALGAVGAARPWHELEAAARLGGGEPVGPRAEDAARAILAALDLNAPEP